jgi:hypothetical protein
LRPFFLAVSLIASHLSTTAKRRAGEAINAEQALPQAQADLEPVSRMTTMGELTASLAHEINQPICAALIDAKTSLRWLKRVHPDLKKGMRGRVESCERHNPGSGCHRSGSPAFRERFSAPGIGRCKRSHSSADCPFGQRGNTIRNIRPDCPGS